MNTTSTSSPACSTPCSLTAVAAACALSLLFCGCVAHRGTQILSGPKLRTANTAKIKEGVTTLNEAIQFLGEPSIMTTNSSGGYQMTWTASWEEMPGVRLVPLAGRLFFAVSRSGYKTVTIQCDHNGIVAEKSVEERRDKWTGDWTWESLQLGN